MKHFLTHVVFLSMAFAGHAQWLPFGSNAPQVGLNDAVLCQTVDEQTNTLIVGGLFTGNATSFLPFVSRWDGNAFSAIGEGFNAPVRCFTWFQGSLFAGGDFTLCGSTPVNHIARWTGSEWVAVADGFNGSVRAFAIYNNSLYAGGAFDSTGTNACSFLAKLSTNQTIWEQAGAGLTFTSPSTTYTPGVYALQVYNGLLYIGGRLNKTANGNQSFDGAFVRYNGFTYTDIPNYFSTTFVSSMKVFNNHLMIGGGDVQFLAEYDGVSFLFGAESVLPNFTVNNPVYAFEIFEDKLYLGGSFTNAGMMEFPDEYVLVLDNEQWYSLDLGLNGPVYSLGIYMNSIVAGGTFTEVNSGQIVNKIARWLAPLEIDSDVNNVGCFGSTDGAIELFPLNGNEPYTYEWSTGSDSSYISGLSAGNYSCTVSDSNGRTGAVTLQVEAPSVLQCSFEINPDNGTGNGSAVAQPIGGTPPYEYSWSNGNNAPEISPVESGLYFLALTDANGCTLSDTIIIPLSSGLHFDGVSKINPIQNPVESEIKFNIPLPSYCSIYDATGRMLIDMASNTISVGHLPSGFYWGLIKTADNTICRFNFVKR